MRIPENIIQKITERVDIIEVISRYVTLKHQGGRYWGLCPFHGEKTPSFTVTPERGLYYCFGCQRGGTIITFIMEVEKLSFPEAVTFLAEKAGIPVDFQFEDAKAENKRISLYDLYKRVAGAFHYILLNKKEADFARKYIEKRGITGKTVETFQIGYAPGRGDWLYSFLLKKSYSKDFLMNSGLFSRNKPRYSFFSNRIVFPIYSPQGNIIGFGGRALDNTGPKYINSPDSEIFKKGGNLFGLNLSLPEIRKSSTFILVEGYIDVVLLYQSDIKNCVAPLGTAFTEQQAVLLKRYAKNAILLFDNDEAGRRATKKAIELCEKTGLSGAVVQLPENLDPADIVQKEGKEALHNYLKYPINSFDYLLKTALESYNSKMPEGKSLIVEELIPYIESIDSEVRRNGCLQLLADALNVEQQSVIADYRKKVKRFGYRAANSKNLGEKKLSIDLFLMIAVIVNRVYFALIRNVLTPDDLEDEKARAIFITMEDCYRKAEESLDSVLNSIDDADLKKIILEKLSSDEFNINQEQIVKDAMARIKQRSLEKRRNKTLQRLRISERQGAQADSLKELLAEKMYLDKELEKLRVIEDDRSAK
ncbi:MAG: DNA primase [Spirochaetota bacterium]